MVQQADLIGVGSLPDRRSYRFFHRRRTGAADRQHAATLWLHHPDRPTGLHFHGARAGPRARPVTDGCRTEFVGHGQRTRVHGPHRADRRHARARHRSDQETGHARALPATVFMLFFLSIISDLVGLAGGLMVAKLFLSLDARQYWDNACQTLVFQDVFMGLLKPTLLRLHHCDRRMLLRDDRAWRHTRRGQGHHPGRGRGVRPYPRHRFLCHQVADLRAVVQIAPCPVPTPTDAPAARALLRPIGNCLRRRASSVRRQSRLARRLVSSCLSEKRKLCSAWRDRARARF